MSTNTEPFKRPMSLGSKARSFIPMTPRSLKSSSDTRNDFAKQVAERSSRGQDGQPPQKKFRSNAAPKGSKLASGYTDRAQARLQSQEEAGDDKQKRLKNLEDMLKLQQIDQATFNALRDEIGVGGDTSSTHLVKGLDFKLLERVRRGEDVNETAREPEKAPAMEDADVEDELEKALERDVSDTGGTFQRPDEEEELNDVEPEVPAQALPMTRDEILRRLKEKRKNLGADDPESISMKPPSSDLNHSKFRKLAATPKSNKKKFIESINGRRREVLIITKKDGTTKRKTRWLDPEPHPSTGKAGKGTTETQAWGNDLPEEVLARQKAATKQANEAAEDDDEDGNIFGDVADYDPLADLESDDEGKEKDPAAETTTSPKQEDIGEASLEPASKPLKSTSTSQSRNYFGAITETETKIDPSRDPAILAALKRAAQMRRQEEFEAQNDSETVSTSATRTPDDVARNKALLKKLQQNSGQDDVDIDMSFSGNALFDDEDEEGNTKQKLSQWKGLDHGGGDDDEDAVKGATKERRKRGGGKKKKGDKNSFADVMNVIEARKKD